MGSSDSLKKPMHRCKDTPHTQWHIDTHGRTHTKIKCIHEQDFKKKNKTAKTCLCVWSFCHMKIGVPPEGCSSQINLGGAYQTLKFNKSHFLGHCSAASVVICFSSTDTLSYPTYTIIPNNTTLTRQNIHTSQLVLPDRSPLLIQLFQDWTTTSLEICSLKPKLRLSTV